MESILFYDKAIISSILSETDPSMINVRGSNSGSFLTTDGSSHVIVNGLVDDWITGNYWELLGIDLTLSPMVTVQFLGSPGTIVHIQGININSTGTITTFDTTLTMTGSPIILFSAVSSGIRTKAWCINSTSGLRELKLVRVLAT